MTFELIFGRPNMFGLSIVEIQPPIAPNVHPKMNTGKECSSAECVRLRSRLHCVTARRVASTRQGVRSAPQIDFRHRPASCAAFQSARGLAHSKTLRVCRGRSEFPPGFGLRQPSAAFPLNRPSQTKFRKRAVQVRNAPVFAPVFTALRRGELLRRGKECGFGVRGHVRALVRRDMSRRGKAATCRRTPRQLPQSSIPK